MPLSFLISRSIGVITINSSVGLQSLYHQKPTKVMGRSFYNIPKITFQGSLDEFWKGYMKPDQLLFNKFYAYTLKSTQINGNFDGRFPFKRVFPLRDS